MSFKRKRFTTGVPLGYSPAGRLRSGPRVHRFVGRPTKRKMFRDGYDRVGGFYGRFSGSMGGGELKFKDLTLADAVVATAGSIAGSLNLIAQGVTEQERIGRKCTIRSLQWRYEVTLPEVDAAGTPSPADSIRVILFIDKQANGATAAITDVLETAALQSFKNLANQNRFVILMDKLHNIEYKGLSSDGAGVSSQAFVVHQYNMYKKCNIPLEFSGATGAITEIRSNNLGVILISSSGGVGFTSQIRLRFSDN